MKIWRLILALTLSACAHAPTEAPPKQADAMSVTRAAAPTRARLDSTPRIAIATAYEPELQAMLPHLRGDKSYTINGVTFLTGDLAGRPVVLFMTGVSIVNAAMNTQLLLDSFTVTDLAMSGIAGGVDPSLSIGDVAIPERWGQYNEAVYLRERAPGVYAPHAGEEPMFPAFLFMGPQGVRIASAADPDPKRRFWFEVDPQLLAAAKVAADKVVLKQCNAEGRCLPHAPKAVVGGSGVTASVFLDNATYREYLFKTFGARVAEMETAAVAMVTHANSVRFIAFRSLSDLAGGGSATQNEIDTFDSLASINAAAFTLAFLEAYQPSRP